MIKKFFTRTKMWVKVTVIVIALALVGSLTWFLVVTPLIMCGSEVRRIDGQCIGVTDGQVALSPDLADVLGKIRMENERVKHLNAEAVSVAYLIPWPKSSSHDELTAVLRHDLEGAYVAQRQANETKTLGDTPLIRLLIANSGDESSQQQRVVADLLAKVNGSDRLVTVVVTGRTKVGTIDAIDSLRIGGIPVVTSRLSGDRLTNLGPAEQSRLKSGLARVAPTGSDEAVAAAVYQKSIKVSRALIVRDVNPDDPFVQSQEEGFRRTFQDGTHTVLAPDEEYKSRLGGVANTMRGMLLDICQQKPDVVFFAGRSPGLAAFVQALPDRPCLDLKMNVMAGGDAVEFATMVARGDQQIRAGLRANASVQYTTQAHPKAWDASPENFPMGATHKFTPQCDVCFINFFPGEKLDDGEAIVSYDAIVTVVTAIRSGQVPNTTPDQISQEFNRLHGANAVPGASGWISLDDQGIPVNKAVVILEVKPDGSQTFVSKHSALMISA